MADIDILLKDIGQLSLAEGNTRVLAALILLNSELNMLKHRVLELEKKPQVISLLPDTDVLPSI